MGASCAMTFDIVGFRNMAIVRSLKIRFVTRWAKFIR
jgi:hypothetical protein